ncbi:MAG: single-stranded-DNA-specific exonuclease RecJ [Sinomicrobium sp.]|nr:single-stranded-DNA-specific exonuclease RecJ [Sinomicrobium sp.]
MRWTIKPKPEPKQIQQLARALNVDALVASLLLQRGIMTFEEARRFFRPSLQDLHDPYLMKDMDKAVMRIEKAIAEGENILVYGDYDVDGTTAVALLFSYLMSFYPNVATYIPDRYEEGYGVSYRGIDFAHDNHFSLIIALDCGIKAVEKVAYAAKKGIDFIICDHHRPGKTLPQAVAVLDPKRTDCTYPYEELCGCGIGFKLVQALAVNRQQTLNDLMPFLDLVVTAIAADIVPVTGENRVLAFCGLQVINNCPRPGIRALVHQVKKKKLDITDVVFIIAPRINAAGRMRHGQYAVELLTETDFNIAVERAAVIEAFNTDRKNLDQQITEEALRQLREQQELQRYTTVVYREDWHKGVIGIVASRLIETYYRPTIVFTRSGDKLAASARSVKGFDIYGALEACSDCLEQFGGHTYAAGLSLEPDQYETFKQKFEAVVEATIDKRFLTPEVTIDTEIEIDRVTPKLYRIIKQFAPFGPGNMKPVFMTRNLRDTGYARGVGEDEKHLKLCVTQNGSQAVEGIGFHLGDKLPLVVFRKPFSAAYTLNEDEWNGAVRLQLKLKDIKP